MLALVSTTQVRFFHHLTSDWVGTAAAANVPGTGVPDAAPGHMCAAATAVPIKISEADVLLDDGGGAPVGLLADVTPGFQVDPGGAGVVEDVAVFGEGGVGKGLLVGAQAEAGAVLAILGGVFEVPEEGGDGSLVAVGDQGGVVRVPRFHVVTAHHAAGAEAVEIEVAVDAAHGVAHGALVVVGKAFGEGQLGVLGVVARAVGAAGVVVAAVVVVGLVGPLVDDHAVVPLVGVGVGVGDGDLVPDVAVVVGLVVVVVRVPS